MCGITGIYCFQEKGKEFLRNIDKAVQTLSKRGPDNHGTYIFKNVALGHSRLSIIDITEAASQPFIDSSGRYTIIFNGEFYNYKNYREQLIKKGCTLISNSDTEVLLYLYIHEGISCLEKINGDFSLAIYDKKEESLFLARDRMGVKPLLYYSDDEKFIFGSEMKSLLAFGIPKEIDTESLYQYFQYNYIPSPNSIFKNVKKISPGEYIFITGNKIKCEKYYSIPYLKNSFSEISYNDAQRKLLQLLDEAVKRRLISDVPLGAFLSGGIDSSIITALATKHVKNFNTFSIGYKDEPYFDETKYANLVAKKFDTNHTVFSLSNNDLFSVLHDVLDYTDEPFADSSSLAVFILSQYTKQKVTVALSGDGADEVFSGYNKHSAHLKALQKNFTNNLIRSGNPIWKILPKSRSGKISNTTRQLNRFAEGLKLSDKERYIRWCSLATRTQVENLLLKEKNSETILLRENEITKYISSSSIYDILYSDMHLVLQGDMLVKADMMSMANSLEVRVPFLDHTVVDFAFSLPDDYKINQSMRKKILQDTFKNVLPIELYNRKKHGFEVPLLKWFRTELKSLIQNDLLNDKFIQEQGIFRLNTIQQMKQKLFSANPDDIHANIWALLVFQNWWKKYFL